MGRHVAGQKRSFVKFLDWLKDRRRKLKARRAFLRSRKDRASLLGEISQRRKETTGLEESNRERSPARALPKLPSRRARQARIVRWKIMRPVFRWQRRSSPLVVLGTYFGIVAFFSIPATVYFLVPEKPADNGTPHSPHSAAPSDPMQLAMMGNKAVRQSHVEPADIEQLQNEADREFRAGNFAVAEGLFQKLLPNPRFRALTGFHIFLCLLMQGKNAEAEVMLAKFPPENQIAKNPSGFYARAALAIKQGRPDDARRNIDSAHAQFPVLSPLYDQALQSLSPEAVH